MAAVEQIGENNVIGIQGDVSNLADLDRLYGTVKDQKGHIDVLFANAGVGEFAAHWVQLLKHNLARRLELM